MAAKKKGTKMGNRELRKEKVYGEKQPCAT